MSEITSMETETSSGRVTGHCRCSNSEGNDDQPCLGENPTVLQILFQYYVNNIRDLTKCRLVSKAWNVEACEKLRKTVIIPLYFSLQPHMHHNQPRKFMEIMDKSFDCPFSMFSIICNEIESGDVQEFFDNVGDLITHLKFRIDGGKHNNNPLTFKKLLTEQLPNLKELQLFGLPESISKLDDLFDAGSSQILRQLQSLTFWRTPGEDNESRKAPESGLFLESDNKHRTFNVTPLYWNVLKFAESMTTFQTNNLNCFYEMFLQGPSLLTKRDGDVKRRMVLGRVRTFRMSFPRMETPPGLSLPSHVISVQFPEISSFCNVFPNITSVDFKFESISNSPTNADIEHMIRGCAKSLRKIRIQRHKYDPNSGSEPRPQPLHFGLMTSLREIVMYHADLHLDPNNFPVLKCLAVTNFCNMNFDGRYATESPMCQVSTLKIGHEKLTHSPVKGLTVAQIDQIVLMFPALRILHFPATDESLHIVYERLQGLEELSIINSNIYSHSAFNAYPELTDEGITGLHMRTCAKIQLDKSYDDVQPTSLRNRPYIGMLKKLQRFYTKGTLTNVSIRFGVADIKELTNLSFCHTQSPRKAPWCVCPSKVSEGRRSSSGSRRRAGHGNGGGVGVGGVGGGSGNAGGSAVPLLPDIDQESICLKPLADNCKALVKLEIKTCHLNSTDAVTQEDCDYIKSRLPNLELIVDDRVEEFLDN